MNKDNTQIPRNVQPKTAQSGFKINITLESVLASAGDFSLAAGCAVAAWQILYGTAKIENFEYSMLFIAESIGLLVLRALLLARGPENNEQVTRFFGSVLITGFGLCFYGTFALIAMVFLIIFSPAAALASMIVFGRRLAWGISNRPTNSEEATIVRGYWKLTRNAWLAALFISGIISFLITLFFDIVAGDPRENALPLVGATIYFSILGFFMLVSDPRMEVHNGFERTFTDPDSAIRPYDIVISTRALIKSYFYLLPGILLIILTTSFLNSMTPTVNHDLITPVFALLGSWLLFGSAVYIQGNGRANSAWNTSIQGLIMFLRRNLLLYFALFFAFWLVLILMFRSFTSYQAGDPELPFLAYPIFGITVLVVTWVLGRLWPLLVLSFQKHPGDEQEGSGPHPYGVLDVWQWTAGYSSWLGCNMWVITALCLGVILPYIASISLDAGLLSVFMQGILFFISLPLFSWVVADRGEALKKALSLP